MKLIPAIAIFFSILSLTACGNKNNGESDTSYTSANGPEPINYREGPDAVSPEQLDEMILMADDLGPAEATGALDYLHALAEEKSGKAREVIMRKFVDLYGIALDNHGDQLRGSINRLYGRTGVDLKAVYEDYSSTLRVGDNDGAGNPDEVIEQKPDSAQITTTDHSEPTSADPETSEPEAVITTSGE